MLTSAAGALCADRPPTGAAESALAGSSSQLECPALRAMISWASWGRGQRLAVGQCARALELPDASADRMVARAMPAEQQLRRHALGR